MLSVVIPHALKYLVASPIMMSSHDFLRAIIHTRLELIIALNAMVRVGMYLRFSLAITKHSPGRRQHFHGVLILELLVVGI